MSVERVVGRYHRRVVHDGAAKHSRVASCGRCGVAEEGLLAQVSQPVRSIGVTGGDGLIDVAALDGVLGA